MWARGQMIDGVSTGYWEDGTTLRSGHFEAGEQVGDWATYDRSRNVYTVTRTRSRN